LEVVVLMVWMEKRGRRGTEGDGGDAKAEVVRTAARWNRF
jgi:hypothetical protein